MSHWLIDRQSQRLFLVVLICAIAIVMRQRLYAFGGGSLKHDNSNTVRPTSSALEPVLEAQSIRVLWAAWCDAVIAYSNNKDGDGDGDGGDSGGGDGDGDGGEEPWPWVLEYIGTGLTTAQKECLTSDGNLKQVYGLREVVFFGSAMHDGLRGYVVKTGNEDSEAKASDADQKIILFGTDLEMEDGVPDVQTFTISLSETEASITDVKIDSEGCVLLYTKSRSTGESVVRFADFTHFRKYVSSSSIDASSDREMDARAEVTSLPSPSPPQHVINSTTTTFLDANMHVWTSTRDPRYPKCLGRPYEGGFDMSPLPYLSESCVMKVASGGYMSAAVSLDGELFFWGQACPGSEGELDVLRADGSEGRRELVTGIGVDGEQDEFVKCADVRIDGEEARVYDVAVGHGHVLVAAEVCGMGGETKRVVFAAGDDSGGQVGLGTDKDFKETFEVIACLRGRQIVQLAAAGWSTYVVSLEE